MLWSSPVMLQGKQILENGIGRASEVEEDLDPRVAEECIQDPTKLVSASDLVKQAVE